MDKSPEKRTEKLLTTLQAVFRDGYRPARGAEPYNVTLNNGVRLYSMVNCFGHIFNLRNAQFNDYHFDSFPMYGNFPGMFYDPQDKALGRMMDFVRATGLQIEECDPKQPIEDFKSWKVALYFEDHPHKRDFHYLLEEQPCLWSSKIGFEPCVEHIMRNQPPKSYRNIVDSDAALYDFYGTYKITNPHADAQNRYLKDFRFSTKGLLIDKNYPKQIIVEDSNAGYEFFSALADNKNYSVLSASGKSHIFNIAKELTESPVLIIADGAAFGSEIAKMMKLVKQKKNIVLHLPESFEWIILKSGIVDKKELMDILSEPEKYIDSEKHFSWEQYFTRLLIDITTDTYLQYSKNKLNEVYLHPENIKRIQAVMKMLNI